MTTIEFPTTYIRLRVLPDAQPLTWEETRRLAHCQIVWKACKRAEAKAKELEAEERQERRRRIFWLSVIAVSAIICLAGLVYLATTETQASLFLTAILALLAISVRYTNKLDGR